MSRQDIDESIQEFFSEHPAFLSVPKEDRDDLVSWVKEVCLYTGLQGIIGEVDAIMGIDPTLDEKDILEKAAGRIMEALGADGASIRILDPVSQSMVFQGGCKIPPSELISHVSIEDSVSGQVVRENRAIAVSSLASDERFKNRDIILKQGFHSMLAVPLRIPRLLLPMGEEVVGSIQIFFREDNKRFAPFQILHAELLARRLSFVLAKRRILILEGINACKERIASAIFEKLSNKEGIKLKDLFVALVPVLAQYLHIKSWSLFSISKDLHFIRLEAAYPVDATYHKIGYTFTVVNHPYFRIAVTGGEPYGDKPFHRIDPAYLLIKDPLRSELVTPGLREFAEKVGIHSILIVPLKVAGIPRYLMVFAATEQKESFSLEEIELLTFLGKEIMKASRFEFLDDVLHDFKNPAIAIAGFASRAKKVLQSENLEDVRKKLNDYLDIIIRETGRLQDLAITIGAEGREELLDLAAIARERFMMNEMAIQASGKSFIQLPHPECQKPLTVYCPRFALERVIDNLLSNATKAVPETGGIIAMKCFQEGNMACLSLRNTGAIPPDKIEEVRAGNVRGRGLNIIYRFVQANHGKVDIQCGDNETVFVIKLPLSAGGGRLD
ncbi:MAG: GAF domain-containing sensor histidine kinase [Deltaproteobacteria bacterium]